LQSSDGKNAWSITSEETSLTVSVDPSNSYVTTFTGIDKLIGGSNVDTFNITAAFTGDIEGGDGDDVFTVQAEVGKLFGNAGNDSFIMGSGGIATLIDGGDGANETNTLIGQDIANTWVIGDTSFLSATPADSSPASSETAYVESFTGINQLVGGTGADHFIIGVNGFVGSINGGEGNDTLQGSDGKNAWSITSEGKSLTVNVDSSNSYVTAFTGINKLMGGSNADTFNINAAFTGDIEGGDGDDVFTVQAEVGKLFGNEGNDSFIMGSNGIATLIDGGDGANETNTLIGQDIANTWVIGDTSFLSATPADSSPASSETAYVESFTGINQLVGGTGADHFIIGVNGFVGSINGGEGNDTLQGSDGKNAWSITSEGKSLTVNSDSSNSYVTTFTGIDKLVGGSEVDTFNITAAFTGDIEGG